MAEEPVKVKLEGKCPLCKKEWSVEVNRVDYLAHRKGMFAQDAYPYLTPGQRELLISGVDEECFDKLGEEN